MKLYCYAIVQNIQNWARKLSQKLLTIIKSLFRKQFNWHQFIIGINYVRDIVTNILVVFYIAHQSLLLTLPSNLNKFADGSNDIKNTSDFKTF